MLFRSLGSRPDRPHDVAPLGSSSTDPEGKDVSYSDPSYGAIEQGEASTVPVDTPFFHLDLKEAVAAAEAGISKHSPKLSRSPTKEDQFGG